MIPGSTVLIGVAAYLYNTYWSDERRRWISNDHHAAYDYIQEHREHLRRAEIRERAAEQRRAA